MKQLFDKIHISINNIELYKMAFRHTSFAYENHKSSYERLEFLGDAVLDLVIADYFYNNFDESEGDMTKERASYVCENANYEYGMSLGLPNYIKVGHGEEESDGRHKKVIVADVFESLIGAIYLDLGFETAKRVILDIVVPYIENPKIRFFSDYKSALQEAVQTDSKSVVYSLIKEEGPDHDKKFTVLVSVDDVQLGIGTSGSKKEAEQEAAKAALEKLAK